MAKKWPQIKRIERIHTDFCDAVDFELDRESWFPYHDFFVETMRAGEDVFMRLLLLLFF